MIPDRKEVEKVIEVVKAIEKEQEKELAEMDKLGKNATIIYEKGVGRVLIKAKDEETYEYVQDYLLAMLKALLWRDPVYLALYEGVEVEDADGVKHPLETDLERIKRYVDMPCRFPGRAPKS